MLLLDLMKRNSMTEFIKVCKTKLKTEKFPILRLTLRWVMVLMYHTSCNYLLINIFTVQKFIIDTLKKVFFFLWIILSVVEKPWLNLKWQYIINCNTSSHFHVYSYGHTIIICPLIRINCCEEVKNRTKTSSMKLLDATHIFNL